MQINTDIPIATKLRELVKGKLVHFNYYYDGSLWYKTDDGFDFPVPVTECGTAVYLHEDKAIYFMRYIRKALEFLEEAKQKQYNEEGETDDTIKDSSGS